MPQLTNNESRGFTHSFSLKASELASGGGAPRTIGTIPRGGIVKNVSVTVITPIAGATDVSLIAGIAADTDGFIAAVDLDALTATSYNTGVLLDTTLEYVNNTTASVPITTTITGTLANITAGEIVFGLTILDPFNLG